MMVRSLLPSFRPSCMMLLTLLLMVLAMTDGFLLSPGSIGSSHRGCHPSTRLQGNSNNFFQQKPGESDMEFFKRIQTAAADSESFERMVLGDNSEKKTTTNNSTSTEQQYENNNNNGKKKGYQRAEDWDAEMKAKQKKGEFTWEERVQFEGQRFGDQVNQNDILKKNLNGF
ncbi:expressed unknown protein [Seminavis robusta]|uniref:Uncharacterized protein n=1 Tax=Seminavis robusta TaxID=568900 RepID=A0A9N8HC76_9STRA|nr:expressed unknown protein [Seminavis robusta]|eukprot:Sro289_g109210.1 n/a (171) ;mRNA; r:68837-69349